MIPRDLRGTTMDDGIVIAKAPGMDSNAGRRVASVATTIAIRGDTAAVGTIDGRLLLYQL